MLKNLADLSKDSKKLEEIGSALVKEAIKQAASEKLGLKDQSPDVVRVVRAGEKVPADLLKDVRIRDSAAESGWEKTWTNLGLWDRNWSQNETDSIVNPGRLADIKAALRANVVFSPEELKVINDMKIFGK